MDDRSAVLKPLQTKSFQFCEGMLIDFCFPLLVQYFILLPWLEILVVTNSAVSFSTVSPFVLRYGT